METPKMTPRRKYPFCEIKRCQDCDDTICFNLHLQKQCTVKFELTTKNLDMIRKIVNPYYEKAVVIHEKYGQVDGFRTTILESFSIMHSMMLYSNNNINWFIEFDEKCKESLQDFINYHEAKQFDKCSLMQCTLY